MDPTLVYLLSIVGFLMAMVIFAGVVYWFGRSKDVSHRIIREQHDQPDAERRIIVLPRQFSNGSPEIELGITLSNQFRGELLFVDVVRYDGNENDWDSRKEELENFCVQARKRGLACGFVLAGAQSVNDGLNQIVREFQAEVTITSWPRQGSLDQSRKHGFLDALVDSCPSRLLLVEETFELPVKKILLPSFNEDRVPFLLGVSSILGGPDEIPNVNILRESRKPGDDLEREQFQKLIDSTIQGTDNIEEEWLRRDVSAQVDSIPAGGFTDEIVDRSQNFEGLIMELTTKNNETGWMYSDLLQRAECPVLLVRGNLKEMGPVLGPVFRVKGNR